MKTNGILILAYGITTLLAGVFDILSTKETVLANLVQLLVVFVMLEIRSITKNNDG